MRQVWCTRQTIPSAGDYKQFEPFLRSMQGSYVRSLLYDLSAKLGRKPQDMDRFVAIFQQNWYESKEALAQLSHHDYTRLQIPERLAVMIAQAVQPPRQQKQQIHYQKMEVQSPIENELNQLKLKLQEGDFKTAIELLSRIFVNIRENLIDQKYKSLKKSNQKVSVLLNFREVVSILKFGGFQDQGHAFVMTKVNISSIDQCIESIGKFMPEATFNPYQSHISSIGKTTVQNYEGPSSVKYNEMLAQLQSERNKVMSQPVKDRKYKLYQIEPTNLKEFERQFQEDKESQEEERYLEMENVKQMLKKQAEEPKFINRRMQEYLDLVKKPVFAETLIRVKLFDNWVFECRFSPLQTLQTLCQVFKECLQNPNIDYYLYMTPPVQKLSGVILRKSFYELGCVPRAIFYFKCEEQLKGNIFKIKKTNLFGS